MKLFIAEKPSLGRAIVDVLPKPHKKYDGYIESSNGDVVTWCIGHLLEQSSPEDYDSKFKKWEIEHLPIVPQQWQLKPKPKTRKQLNVIKKLVKKADVIVNAGDVDREGQLLVDEAISYCGATKNKIDNAMRCLISDMNYQAVKKAVNSLQPNKNYLPLAVSALARTRADWLYGLNMTRLCTLKGKSSGYQGVLSIGRVQTPILGLIVNRDIEIDHFVSKPFYEVIAEIQTEKGEVFKGKWQPSEACEPYMDEDRRVLSQKLAATVVNRIENKHGKIKRVTQSKKHQSPPLPFSLSGLQIAAAKAYGMTAKQVLDTCQHLYEKHKLITYPRSDCQYLPTEHLKDVPAVTHAISNISDNLVSAIKGADLSKKSRAWNNKKVSAHHAIIPTSKNKPTGTLTSNELKVYELIARQYIIQFYPNFEYVDKRIESSIGGGLFISKQKDIINNGWKNLFSSSNNNKTLLDNKINTDYNEENNFSMKKLPEVKLGDEIYSNKASVLQKDTSSPKAYTDATILSALTGISRYVTDVNIKKVLKDSDGLGTEATRAGIIELLFNRKYLTRKGKEIKSTELGRKLITALPIQISKPDMTALWESQLESISTQSINYQSFIGGVELNLERLINEVKNITFIDLPNIQVPKRFTRKRKTRRKAK